MKVKRLKEIINNIEDDTIEIFIRNSFNPCGNIQQLEQIEKSTYGFFGTSIPCLILNTENSKQIETDEQDQHIDFIENSNN